MMDLSNEPKAKIKTGNEPLYNNGQPLQFNLLHFWQWSVSDILSNSIRGRLAEFIVATATGVNLTTVRSEWDAYDLLTPEGIKLEIKSAAYLQTWQQSSLSKISFSTKLARSWDFAMDKRSEVPLRHADVYVFCLLKHQIRDSVDPLNLNHWDFYVLSTAELNKYTRSQHSITLNSLQRLTQAINYDDIDSVIKKKHQLNNIQAEQ